MPQCCKRRRIDRVAQNNPIEFFEPSALLRLAHLLVKSGTKHPSKRVQIQRRRNLHSVIDLGITRRGIFSYSVRGLDFLIRFPQTTFGEVSPINVCNLHPHRFKMSPLVVKGRVFNP